MDHSDFSDDYNDKRRSTTARNDNSNNSRMSIRGSLQGERSTTTTTSVFLVPMSSIDNNKIDDIHHHNNNPQQQQQQSVSPNSSRRLRRPRQQQQQHHQSDGSDLITLHSSTSNSGNYPLEDTSHYDDVLGHHQDDYSNTNATTTHRPLPHPLSYYSAPTDEENAYSYSISQRQQQHRHHQQQEYRGNAVGTTATNPIMLHSSSENIRNNENCSQYHLNDETGEFANVKNISSESLSDLSAKIQPARSSEKKSMSPTNTSKGFTTGATKTVSNDDWNTDTGGGRLWRLAGEVAAGRISLLDGNRNHSADGGSGGPVRQIKESLMERMRSRADPDALCIATTSMTTFYSAAPQNHNYSRTSTAVQASSNTGRTIKMPMVLSSSSLSLPLHPPQTSSSGDTDDHNNNNLFFHHNHHGEDEAFLINTGLAQKRVRVVQLMIVGVFGILLPWMGNVFVSSSCYFASVNISVGVYGNMYLLHFGLWNYSPVSSALNGYKYCYPYHHFSNDDNAMNQYPSDPPILSRILNSLALLTGTYSLVILWWYLISGRVRRRLWKAAVYTAIGAGIFQLATPIFFFLGRACRNNHCSLGPGTVLSVVTATAWFIFGAELYYHSPLKEIESIHPEFDEKLYPLDDKSFWLSRMGNTSWHDVRGPRQAARAPVDVDVSQLELSDFASASQQYFNRFYPYESRQYNPPNI